MIRYILLLVLFIPGVANDNFYDKNSSSVTDYDLKLMQKFDSLAYELSDTKLESLDIQPIYQFMYLHKRLIIDYSLLQIDFKASAGIDDYDYEADRERDKDYKKVGITLTYPLYDKKTIKDIKNKKLDFRFKILDEIKKYSILRDKKIALNRELKFNRLIQIKEKLQNSILDNKSNLTNARIRLLNYVKKPYQDKLMELLK